MKKTSQSLKMYSQKAERESKTKGLFFLRIET